QNRHTEGPVPDGPGLQSTVGRSERGQARPSRKPWRHDGKRSFQPSSRLALALEKPRPSAIMITAASPATSRASHGGIRIGGLAPTDLARYGSHWLAGAGSSSTMLNTPFACCSTASTVALAASSTCTNELYPVPAPTSGNCRLRINFAWSSVAPGP